MKALMPILEAVAIANSAAAYDLGDQVSPKPIASYTETIPSAERPGGDTIATATAIPVPSSAKAGTDLDVQPFVPCAWADTPARDEGEPPLADEYEDVYNGGCYTPGYPLQALYSDSPDEALTFRGVSGWYRVAGEMNRDTDWFVLSPTVDHRDIEIDIDAEQRATLYRLSSTDCTNYYAVDIVEAGPCQANHMTIALQEWSVIWICVAPSWPAPSDTTTFDYLLWISPLWHVAVEPTTWGGVKALYR